MTDSLQQAQWSTDEAKRSRELPTRQSRTDPENQTRQTGTARMIPMMAWDKKNRVVHGHVLDGPHMHILTGGADRQLEVDSRTTLTTKNPAQTEQTEDENYCMTGRAKRSSLLGR